MKRKIDAAKGAAFLTRLENALDTPTYTLLIDFAKFITDVGDDHHTYEEGSTLTVREKMIVAWVRANKLADEQVKALTQAVGIASDAYCVEVGCGQ